MAKTTEKKSKADPTDPEEGFTAEERAAMKARAAELRSATKRGKGKGKDKAAADAADVLAKIAELSPAERGLAERLHAIITAAAPELAPRLWYGMPAYAKDGKILCHFQSAEKFKTRYASLGFSDEANLDDGALWPVAYGITELGDAEEKAVTALIKKAVS